MGQALNEFLQRQREVGERISSGRDSGLEGFIGSAISSMTREMVGLDPTPAAEAYRGQNPVGGLTSQITGFAVPYVGWARASRAIPAFESFVTARGASLGSTSRGALQSVTRFAPFEAGRVLGAAVVGGDIGETALESGINLGLEAGLGAVGGALRAYGQRTSRQRLFEAAGVGPGDSLQNAYAKVQGQLRAAEESGEAVALGNVRDALGALRESILTQVPAETAKGGRAIYSRGRLEIGGTPGEAPEKGIADAINRWFALPAKGVHTTQSSARGRISQAAVEALGGDDVLPHIQFPRELIARGRDLRAFRKGLLEKLQPVGDFGWIGKEADDGLWIVAKKIPGVGLSENLPKAARAQADAESFALFKTDRPGIFFPEQELWSRRVAERAFVTDTVARLPDTGSPLTKALQDYFDMVDFQVVGGSRRGALPRLMSKIGADKLGDHELVARIQDLAKKYVFPAYAQAGRNLRHRRLDGAMRYVFDQAEDTASRLLYGKLRLDKNRSPLGAILHGGTHEGGIIAPIRASTDQVRQEFHRVLEGMSEFVQRHSDQIKAGDIDEVQFIDRMYGRGEISQETHSLLRQLQAVDAELQRIRTTTEEALGLKSGFKPLFGHMLLSRTWEGQWRSAILDANGNKIWIVGAQDRGGVQRKAQELIDELERTQGKTGLRVGRTWAGDRASDLKETFALRSDMPEYRALAATQRELLRRTGRPQFYQPRTGHGTQRIGGAITDRPLSVKELEEIVAEHVGRQLTHLGELTVRKGMLGELDRLRLEAPDAFEILMQRINDKAGIPSNLSRSINNAIDAVASPVIGPNSATRIVHTANRFMYNMELGMGNLMFPIVNALTFMQTTLPHLAYVMKAHPDMIQQYYSTFPVAGADGLIRGSAHSLNPLRVAWSGMKLMRDYDKDPLVRGLIERALNARVIEPRFVEKQIGSQADRLRRFKDIPKEGGYVDAIEAVSSFLPSMSERFARGHSFMTGVVLGRDILRLADEDKLYQFAKEFTDNTMFLYSTADRARIITGPLGTLFGLFKNWQMHYMSWMFTYGREGFLRDNWAPLLWQLAGTWSVAGAKGLPAYGTAEAFSEWATDKSMLENIYTWFGDADRDPWIAGGDSVLPDAIYMGLPGMLGLSLTSSTAAPFADPVRDAGMLMSFVQWDRAQALGRAVGTAVEDWATTGRHPVRDDATRRQFVRALAPRTVYRAMSVFEDDMLRSTTNGYPSISGLSAGERWMYGLGFNPRWIALQFEVQKELWASQESLRSSIQYYGRQIADAQDARDWREVTMLSRQAMLRGVPMDSVWWSVRSRRSKMEEDTISRQFDAAAVGAFRQSGLVR